jgi:hypothetical protein
MKIEYNNLYTHFIFTTFLRERVILETRGNELKSISLES